MLHRQPHLRSLRIRVARRRRPMVAQPRQRTLGVRRERLDAATRREHQRLQDQREREAGHPRVLTAFPCGFWRATPWRSSLACAFSPVLVGATWLRVAVGRKTVLAGDTNETCGPICNKIARAPTWWRGGRTSSSRLDSRGRERCSWLMTPATTFTCLSLIHI